MVSATATVMSRCREALGETLLFGGLPDDLLDELAERSYSRRFAKGQVVLDEGEPGGDVLVVAEGRLKVLVRSREGVEVVLTAATRGDTLGEVSVFDEAPRSAAVEAVEPTVVVTVPGRAVRDVVRRSPELAEEVMRQQAALIRRATGMVADLVFLDLPRRVAKQILQRAAPDGTVDLQMSQGELAAAVGGVRQSVNAALRGFERRGWLRLEGRSVLVLERAALARYAGTDA